MMTTPARLRGLVPPVIALAAVVVLWSAAIDWFGISGYMLPRPGQVALALIDGMTAGDMAVHVMATVEGTVAGYLTGCGIGFLLALAVYVLPWLRQVLHLPILLLQAMPKVAVAPLLFFWLGFDLGARVTMVALLCFFPVFVNTLSGLDYIDRLLVDLYRAAGASRARILLEVGIPAAAPSVFAALQVSVMFAIVGDVVMEFVGASAGLGFKIQTAANAIDLPTTFAAIVMIGLIGAAAVAVVRLAERRVIFWEAGGGPKVNGVA